MYPMDVLVLAEGRIVVAEQGRQQLAVFDDSGAKIGTITATDLDAESICTQRVFGDWSRDTVAVFARREREVWAIRFSVA